MYSIFISVVDYLLGLFWGWAGSFVNTVIGLLPTGAANTWTSFEYYLRVLNQWFALYEAVPVIVATYSMKAGAWVVKLILNIVKGWL